MIRFGNNIMVLAVIFFAVCYVLLGLLLVVQTLRQKITVADAATILIIAVLLGGFVIYAGNNFLGSQTLITSIGGWAEDLISGDLAR